ncbi:MAG TPA: hypothetical protein VGJ94_09970 [Syntrophorhabdaceae bacterium]|jgi:hypothetical protein
MSAGNREKGDPKLAVKSDIRPIPAIMKSSKLPDYGGSSLPPNRKKGEDLGEGPAETGKTGSKKCRAAKKNISPKLRVISGSEAPPGSRSRTSTSELPELKGKSTGSLRRHGSESIVQDLNRIVKDSASVICALLNVDARPQVRLSKERLRIKMRMPSFMALIRDAVGSMVRAAPHGATLTISTHRVILRNGPGESERNGRSASCAVLRIVHRALAEPCGFLRRALTPASGPKATEAAKPPVRTQDILEYNGADLNVERRGPEETVVNLYFPIARTEKSKAAGTPFSRELYGMVKHSLQCLEKLIRH